MLQNPISPEGMATTVSGVNDEEVDDAMEGAVVGRVSAGTRESYCTCTSFSVAVSSSWHSLWRCCCCSPPAAEDCHTGLLHNRAAATAVAPMKPHFMPAAVNVPIDLRVCVTTASRSLTFGKRLAHARI